MILVRLANHTHYIKGGFCIKQLVSNYETEELKREILDAEIIIGQPPLALLQNPEINCPKLKMIQMTWAGTDIYICQET